MEKALQKVGGEVRIVQKVSDLKDAERLVLPGVGAFRDCMRNLDGCGMIDGVRDFICSGKPFLGICLGYQALFDRSEEGRDATGLGILAGSVVRFSDGTLKVPQIGWNQIRIQQPDCPLLQGIKDNSYVYFVHSYFPKPADSRIVASWTEYGVRFASMVWRDNVFACQFHPEKSQAVGLRLLQNFVKLRT